jgi:hypothetical protein
MAKTKIEAQCDALRARHAEACGDLQRALGAWGTAAGVLKGVNDDHQNLEALREAEDLAFRHVQRTTKYVRSLRIQLGDAAQQRNNELKVRASYEEHLAELAAGVLSKTPERKVQAALDKLVEAHLMCPLRD